MPKGWTPRLLAFKLRSDVFWIPTFLNVMTPTSILHPKSLGIEEPMEIHLEAPTPTVVPSLKPQENPKSPQASAVTDPNLLN